MTMKRLCDLLEDVLHGRDAAAARLSAMSGVAVVAPMWLWTLPQVPMGRKTAALPGGLAPVRLVCATGSSVAFHDSPVPDPVEWSASGLGASASGVFFGLLPRQPGEPRAALVRIADAQRAVQWRDVTVEQAHRSRWALMRHLESMTETALVQANRSASLDVNGSDSFRPVLDDTKLESIRDGLVYGDRDHDRDGVPDSVLSRLLDRCLEPDVFEKVDPSRFLTVAVRRYASQEVRRAIHDPQCGSRLRKLARENGWGLADVDLIVDHYNRTWPDRRIGRDAARNALLVASDAMGRWVSTSSLEEDR